MRFSLSCIGMCTTLMLTSTHALATSSVHELSNGNYFKGPSDGEYYIQAATFKSAKNAKHFKDKLTKKYNQPVTIKQQKNYQVVYLGPIHKAAEARALANSMEKAKPMSQETYPPLKNTNNTQQKRLNLVADKDGILPVISQNHFEIVGGLGIANLRGGQSYLGVTSDETDRLVQTNSSNWNAFTGQIGIGYIYYLYGAQQYSENAQWFPWIEPAINAYYLGRSSIKGDVWRFGDPAFNDMTFKMPVNSYRLMFDTTLTIVSKQQYSLFGIAGIGNAWNRVSYKDADRTGVPCNDQFLDLGANSHSNFAWELGAGLAYAFNNRFAISLEYLYANLGNAQTSNTGYTGTITTPVVVPANFSLTSQAALIGLHLAI